MDGIFLVDRDGSGQGGRSGVVSVSNKVKVGRVSDNCG